MNESIMGSRRVRTDVRLPVDFQEGIDEVCDLLGIPKNAFYSLAAGYLLAEMSPILKTATKRRIMLKKMGAIFQKAIDKALESA